MHVLMYVCMYEAIALLRLVSCMRRPFCPCLVTWNEVCISQWEDLTLELTMYRRVTLVNGNDVYVNQ